MMFKKITEKELAKAGLIINLLHSVESKIDLLTKSEQKLITAQKGNKGIPIFNHDGQYILVAQTTENKSTERHLEALRIKGFEISNLVKTLGVEDIAVFAKKLTSDEVLAFTEGFKLSLYRYNKYKKEKDKRFEKTISVCHEATNKIQLDALAIAIESNFLAKDWVNEPVIDLTAVNFSKSIKQHLEKVGVNVKILGKKELEKLGMGGILSVNKGSIDPPTFTILEWNPKNAVNKKPLVLVGKGLVFDTGGLSLKPTKNSMDKMKCDMGGGASVAAGLYGIAKSKIPLHIITLIPATDNRPGGNAITPGDVITMYDGTTVEVLNTDAEGRLILADALAYAKQYKPALVIDFATLTGTAMMTTGHICAVFMGNAEENYKSILKECGELTAERLTELPFYDEYKEFLKSDIADLQNVGGSNSGSITAGKFLEHFTDFQFLHVDIAGTAYLDTPFNYRGKNGSGYGARLLIEFAKKLTEHGGKIK